MKKLLVLALVLGLAGLSSAGLEFVVDGVPGGSAAVNGENVFGLLLKVELQDVTGDLQLDVSGVQFPTGFDLPGKSQNVTPMSAELTISNIFGAPKSGPMVTGITWEGTGTAWIVFSALKGGNTVDGQVLPEGELARAFIVPEPMTLGLLGLGALFLRRRK